MKRYLHNKQHDGLRRTLSLFVLGTIIALAGCSSEAHKEKGNNHQTNKIQYFPPLSHKAGYGSLNFAGFPRSVGNGVLTIVVRRKKKGSTAYASASDHSARILSYGAQIILAAGEYKLLSWKITTQDGKVDLVVIPKSIIMPVTIKPGQVISVNAQPIHGSGYSITNRVIKIW